MPGQLVNNAADLRSYKKLVVVSAILFGGKPSVLKFVVTVFVKTDGERLYRLSHMPRHERDYRTRVDTTRQESPQWYVRNETQAHRLIKQRAQLLNIFVFASAHRWSS